MRNPHQRFTATPFKRGWRIIGGKRYSYRSLWEANYARYLQFRKERGEIKDWFYERTTYKFAGLTRGCTQYTADFDVIELDDSVIHHEVKGYMDAKSATKLKRMKKYHPAAQIMLIDQKEFKLLTKHLPDLIAGWET